MGFADQIARGRAPREPEPLTFPPLARLAARSAERVTTRSAERVTARTAERSAGPLGQ